MSNFKKVIYIYIVLPFILKKIKLIMSRVILSRTVRIHSKQSKNCLSQRELYLGLYKHVKKWLVDYVCTV